MHIRITPLSTFSLQPRSGEMFKPNRFAATDRLTKSKPTLLLPPSKRQSKNVNNTLMFSRNQTTLTRPIHASNKSDVLLYQQIEKNKPLSNSTELINRFHFKV